MVVDPRAPVEAPPGKIEVVEFFWYDCPHCNAFEPILAAWHKRLPKDIAFRRVPVAFNDSFAPQQRLYFALEAMGLVDKLHAKVFAAIHSEGTLARGAKGEAITEWVVQAGRGPVQVRRAVQLLLGGVQGQPCHAAAKRLQARRRAGAWAWMGVS